MFQSSHVDKQIYRPVGLFVVLLLYYNSQGRHWAGVKVATRGTAKYRRRADPGRPARDHALVSHTSSTQGRLTAAWMSAQTHFETIFRNLYCTPAKKKLKRSIRVPPKWGLFEQYFKTPFVWSGVSGHINFKDNLWRITFFLLTTSVIICQISRRQQTNLDVCGRGKNYLHITNYSLTTLCHFTHTFNTSTNRLTYTNTHTQYKVCGVASCMEEISLHCWDFFQPYKGRSGHE